MHLLPVDYSPTGLTEDAFVSMSASEWHFIEDAFVPAGELWHSLCVDTTHTSLTEDALVHRPRPLLCERSDAKHHKPRPCPSVAR